MSDLAPVVLFVFNRPEKTSHTLAALAGNALAAQSDLFIYSDAPRAEADLEAVREVRRIVRGASGFRSITLIEREVNLGLAKNIVDGVSAACERYGRVIVLEDDIVTLPDFLRFMNAALARYSDEPRVWHISGWNYPIPFEGLGAAYFWRVMNCWGWATWKNRWQHYKKEPQRILATWGTLDRRRFNVDGAYQFFAQIVANYTGEKNTWAVFWYATIFEHGGLCLTVARSLVQNIGADGSGTHDKGSVVSQVSSELTAKLDVADMPVWNTRFLPGTIQESTEAVARLRNFYRSSFGLRDKLRIFVATYLPIWGVVSLKHLGRLAARLGR